ncbi:MAG: GNAT family N-acetyltransferase [Phycisphaerae bacterium]
MKTSTNEHVSLTLVTDPFGVFDVATLQDCFDLVIRFKEHFVTDLHLSMNEIATKYHRKNARRALRDVQVERCEEPRQFLDDWVDLYRVLSERHNIRGIRAFSRAAFAMQLSIPGVVMFRAMSQGIMVGAHIWFVQDEAAYSHLSAYSPTGYELRASYALYWRAIEYFREQGLVAWLDGGAGISRDGTDNLSQFKQGWSTATRPVWLCGCILNRERYAYIVNAKGVSETTYFPAYRRGEFA